MKSGLKSLLLLSLGLILVLTSCGRGGPTPLPLDLTQPPAATPTTGPFLLDAAVLGSDEPLAPQVTGQRPDANEEASPSAAFEIYFDQPMESGTTQRALSVYGPDGKTVQGEVSWPDQRVLRFKPLKALLPSATYLASLSPEARSQAGVELEELENLTFRTAGDLQVTQVSPAPDTVGVDPDALITVIFNRPVVPLMSAQEQDGLPQLLEISPSVDGHGEWLNTSVYVFRLDEPLAGSTTYRARLQAGLADTLGMTLPNDFSWEFTTAAPGINALMLPDLIWGPPDYLEDVPLDQPFLVSFLQPMDTRSTERASSLTDGDGTRIPLDMSWNAAQTELTITPSQRLALGTVYTLRIERAAQAKMGGGLHDGLEWNFTTVRPPGIKSTNPYDGQRQAEYNGMLEINFASPMKQASLVDKVVLSPEPPSGASWMFSDWSMFYYGLEPSTRYTVRVLPGMQDVYGNEMKEGYSFSFETAAYPPSARLAMPYAPALFRAGGPLDFFASYVNVEHLNFELYRLNPKELAGALTSSYALSDYIPSPSAELVRQWDVQSEMERNERSFQTFPLQDFTGDPLTPGVYFLTLDSPEVKHDSRVLDARLLVVATANLTFKTTPAEALVWLTDLASGQPVAGQEVVVYDDSFTSLGRGTTDADGLLHLELPIPDEIYQPRYATAGQPESEVFAVVASNWSDDINLYEMGIWTDYYTRPGDPVAYVYTDRPLYRPGQTVYLKGVIRLNDDLRYSLPVDEQVQVAVESMGQFVYTNTLELSAAGAFEGELVLAEEAALGDYSISVCFPGDEFPFGYGSFSVAEYRKPEFLVDLEVSPVELLAGESFNATLSADFYSGGPVAGAGVNWVLAAQPYPFWPGGELSAYSFTDDEEDAFAYGRFDASARIISQGDGLTGPDGTFSLDLQAESAGETGSQLFSFEATVYDLTGNPVSARAGVVAHQSTWYPGIRPERYVGRAGQEQAFEVVLVDWDGEPVAGQVVEVEIVERRWHSVQEEDAQGRLRWTSAVENLLVQRFEAVQLDADGKATVRYTPPNGGIFRARVTARDAGERQASSAAYQWVAGEDYIPWRLENDRTFRLVADQAAYTPGDTAEILIPSPFQGEAYALVTVERGHILRQEVIRLESNSAIYRLPVTAEMAPNAYVSVMVVKGVDEESSAPASFKIGMAEIAVDRQQQTLTVEITTDRAEAGPGEEVIYTIYTAGAGGRPVQADVSLALVDLAVLSLTGPNSPPMIDFFYPKRYLSVLTSVPLSLNMEEFNAQIRAEQPEGQGAGSGGGKGGGELGIVEVRGDFRDTAFWRGSLTTGPDGRASVSLTLPDNLTTWRMDARAATADTRVGQAAHDLVSSKPLLVRPQTPRFFVAGDQAWLSAAVHNNTGEPLEVAVSLGAGGVTLQDEQTQTISVPAFSQRLVGWDVAVMPDADRVDLLFSASGGDLTDASRPPLGTLSDHGLPVYRFEALETVGTAGSLSEAGYRMEAVSLPVFGLAGDSGLELGSLPSTGSLEVQLDLSLSAGLAAGLRYLEELPYDYVEQTVSRFLPNAVTARLLRQTGKSDPELESGLAEQVNLGLQRLYNQQHADGGWGWWPTGDSDSLVTAYAVLGLVEARESGFAVDEGVLERGVRYLRDGKLNVRSLDAQPELNRMAFLYYVLARAGQPNVSQTVQLFDLRQKLSLYAQAFLAMALQQIDPADPRLETIFADLTSQSALSAAGAHWDEPDSSPDYWNWNTNTRTTAIVLLALLKSNPDTPVAENAVRWLMAHRTAGHWCGSQETAWALMALSEWLAASGELDANYRYEAALNGESLAQGEAGPANLHTPLKLDLSLDQLLSGEPNRLVIARDEGPGRLYYTAHLNFSLPVEQVTALERGIVVSRAYYRTDDRFTPVGEVSPGEVFLARLTIIAPHDLHYLVVEDPLPAGLEPVDPALETSMRTGAPSLDNWENDPYSGFRGWGWWYFRHVQLRDEKLVLSVDYLPAGTYEYAYLVRAATPGDYSVIPPTAHEIYFPEVYGRGEGMRFIVR